jgi:hypothetical protein
MTRRRRVARFLDRLGDLLRAVFVDPGPVLSQADIDAGVAEWAKYNR